MLTFFPTLIDLVELKQLDHLDGNSLSPLMLGKQQKVKDFAVSQYPRRNTMGYSFRTANHRYTLWIDKEKIGSTISDDDIKQEELFDYIKDPLETENHIGKNGYENIYNKLKQQAFGFSIPTQNQKRILVTQILRMGLKIY